MKLTTTKARAMKKPGMFADGGGLYLRVAEGGSKAWIYRGSVNGKRRKVGLGGWPSVSLAQAREKAAAIRAAIAEGRDPKRQVPTFADAAASVHELSRAGWKHDRHARQWIASLERHAFPAIGNMPLDRITRGDVLAILTPLWTAKPETARRLRQRIRSVLKFGMAHGWIEHNAAGEAIDGALPTQPRLVKGHFTAMPHSEVAGVLEGLAATPAGLCLRFLILTACRSGEARGASWDEIQGDTWTIPAARMKAGRQHRVPLSGAALAVLAEARRLGSEGMVFPSSGQILSGRTLSRLLRKVDDTSTVHGFRSSFRDWCADAGQPRELAEAALAHVVTGIEGSYFRSDLFERRRALMQAWADYLDG